MQTSRMESAFDEAPQYGHSMQMLEKAQQFPSFLGRRSFVPRPISGVTEFSDLDEASDLYDSPRSLDSGSTASSRDSLATPFTPPQTGGLGGFTFHFDDKPVPVEGPVGPHLFRTSAGSLVTQLRALDLGIDNDEPQAKQPPAKSPTSRPFNTLNQAVAELDECQVRSWTPRQVAEWMADAGFDQGVVEKFLIHDISGSVLLDLQFEDLKELDISSFGKRHQVMSSIHHLRNSSLITPETPILRTHSKSPFEQRTTPTTLQRPVGPEECRVVPGPRSTSRRRQAASTADVTPAESISIVAIEQLLPKPHKCSKGENCAKWRKQQRKLERIQREFAVEAERALAEEAENTDYDASKLEAIPSVVGSSDVLGAAPSFKITADRLNQLNVRDPQDSVRQFLNFQHISGKNAGAHGPSPPPAASASFMPAEADDDASSRTTVTPPNHQDELRGQLPKLFIPASKAEGHSSDRTPALEFANADTPARAARAYLLEDPYHYGGVASPADIYRSSTPFSAADAPVTAHAVDPCERVFSNSVPPEMQYGTTPTVGVSDPVRRIGSTPPAPRRRHTKPTFEPTITPVKEDFPTTPAEPASARASQAPPPTAHGRQPSDILSHSGWMRKRKTKLMRHEWQDMYFSLAGTRLMMLENDLPERGLPVDYIDVDLYDVHAYSQATSSKLSAAIKKSILRSDNVASTPANFAFSLIPDREKNPEQVRKVFDKGAKSHHFAVKSGSEKVEWMRRLMLAKAACKNASGTDEI